MLIRKLSPEEFLDAAKISILAFEVSNPDITDSPEEYYKKISENPSTPGQEETAVRWGAFDDDGKLTASIVVMPFSANFDGGTVPVYGIGDVSTLPHCRRGGAIRACFASALKDMYKSGAVFSYLYPFSYKFYRKFGYELSAQTVFYKVDLRSLPKVPYDGHFKMYEPGADISDFNEAYEKFSVGINFMLQRGEVLWKRRMTSFSPYKDGRWAFVWHDADDNPRAYFSYSIEKTENERVMKIHDFCFDSAEALRVLLTFISGYSSWSDYVEFPMPPHIPIEDFLGELCGNVSRKIAYTGMLRVVNAKKTLKLAKYQGSGEFVISITDENIQNNNAIFAVKFGEGKTEVEITDRAPDIETDIRAFSKLISGAVDLECVNFSEGIVVNSNTETLKKAFYKKPLWINDYF
ncbi:MAG: GNAT family N-acetyltransferase [Clostridia bacterium]|nr:GNAT family N-acetyltransferase [Clostridia bacterium]